MDNSPIKDFWIEFQGYKFCFFTYTYPTRGGSVHVIISYIEVAKSKIKGGTLKHLIEKMTPVNKKDRGILVSQKLN
jgi:hypothetical protein